MTTFSPSPDEFAKNAKAGKSQLVWTWVPADLETPVSVYLKLTQDSENSFLLESVEGGATLGRYSAIGLAPDLIWSYKKNSEKNPLAKLRELVKDSRIDIVAPEIPPMGPSGLFGYMGYDMVRLIEDIPDENPDMLDIPDSIMIRPTMMAIFDNVKSQICLVTPVRDSNDSYDAAIRRLEKIIDRLADPVPQALLYPTLPPSPSGEGRGEGLQTPKSPHPNPLPKERALNVTSNMTESAFHKMVDQAVEYIRAGEIFQVVLGQSFSMPFDLPAFSLYRSLRRLNPSPFLFYFNFGKFQIVGSSPEILVRVRNRRVTIRPIAGTRRRGKTSEEDAALAEELLNDPKERAEHLMLLDLGRNDVGRVAKTGTVKVTDKFIIERYSHVMHIVSNVEGELRDDIDSLDALFAGFPAGTVSGAPKVRAMEIIEELEPTRRGYYGGCIGYLDGNGDLDTCIALRTSLIKDGKIHVQASGGIVADSTPDFEFKESVMKARAIVQAADEAVSQALRTQAQQP
jgi:anthranilate synthase component 1